MPKRHTNHMKATVWTPTMSSTFEGTPDGCIPLAFYALETPERRAACIAQLQEIDRKLSAKASQPPQEN